MKEVMKEGIIVKGIAGFYYVDTDVGLFECKARGRFRNENIVPTVGDKAVIQVIDLEKRLGNVDEIMPRRNELIRPKVCNIDQAVVVFAANRPAPNMDLLDRFILLIEEQNIDIVICINKMDIDDENIIEKIRTTYKNSGYQIIATSIVDGVGLNELKECLKDKITVLAGPSGAGKSSLLNEVQPDLKLKTGEISLKIGRGKHTTRHAELIELNTGGYIVDSPGFTSLAINHIERDMLQHYFREFEPFIGNCKFNGCSHTHEPSCAIIKEVGNTIAEKRYLRYKKIYNELEEQRRNKYD